MSLRLRLTILYSALTGGILLVFGALLFFLVNILLTSQVDTTLQQTVMEVTRSIHVGSVGELNVVTLPQLDLTANVYIQIWDTRGNLQSSSPGISRLGESLDPAGLEAGRILYHDTYIQGAHLRVLTVPLVVVVENEQRPVGVIQAAANLGVVDSIRRTLLEVVLATAAVSMFLAASASWFIIGQAVAPLAAVTETALQISRADDLSRRIPYRGADNDEGGRLVAAFNATLERLETLFSAQQRFLADVSHELRTPLTVIKGNVELMRKMGNADEESLSSIEDEADRLTRLVGDLLLETQAESGKLPLSFAPVELDTLLLEVFKEMRVLARERVRLKVTGIDQIQVHGDRDRLKQVLINMVSNAITYTPAGGEVTLGLARVGDHARIVVHDTGPGIPPEDLPHIFERFYRAEKSRTRAKHGGFGLGLSIAYWIVSHHGGRIEVEAPEGQGTTFCIWLPVLAAGN
ncbi:MAG: two-component sensor histidine kinase [Anaerolineaceae bacterium]|nr:MAG: two-component sensor histidine kinase [Anaerolineaceae bacterium]